MQITQGMLFNNIKVADELRQLLGRKRIPKGVQGLLIKEFGDHAGEMVRSNPYMLMKYERVGWETCEQIAGELNYSPAFEPRIEAGIEHAMKNQSFMAGHVCLPRHEAFNLSRKVLGYKVDNIDVHQGFDRLTNKDRICYSNDMLYLSRLFREERFIAHKLRSLMASHVNPKTVSHEGLAEDQIHACKVLANAPVGILTGPPGTGKTYTLKRIIDAAVDADVALAAPTGKAAKRMMDMTGASASTIHRLLGAFMDEETGHFEFRHDADFPLPHELIVIDETSMIDQNLMYRLLMAIEEGTRLLLVGDIDQLPPVGMGNVLRDAIKSDQVPTVSLETIKRQDPGNIITACHRIRVGDGLPEGVPIFRRRTELPRLAESITECGDLWGIQCATCESVATVMEYMVAEYLPSIGYHKTDDIQIITPYRERTEVGCKALNERMQKRLTGVPESRNKFCVGDKVIQTRNDYDLEIINGDIGYVRGFKEMPFERIIEVEFSEPERLVEIPYSDHRLQLAYAITCHKFQGSEQKVILMPVHPDLGDFFVQRNWLYTAVSRASRLCILIGDMYEVGNIAKRSNTFKRYTQLAQLLQEGQNAVKTGVGERKE